MAVCMVFDMPGGTQEQYDQVVARVIAKTNSGLQPGQIFHAAGASAKGWRVVDVWESEEAAQRFFQETLQEAVQGTGFPLGPPAVFPVHRMEPQLAP